LNDDWNNKKSIEDFYKSTKNYLYDLVAFNNIERVKQTIYPIKDFKGIKILDYAGGVGEIGMALSEGNKVYYYDVNDFNKSFAKFSSQKTGRPLIILDTLEQVKNLKYEIIILMDILEHLDEPMELLKSMENLLVDHGFIVTSGLNYGLCDSHPMHLASAISHRDEFNKYMQDNYVLRFYHETKYSPVYVWSKK